ncbi:cholesterol 7-alpha-monooxygenase [Achaetomium macrosporum]|uniref:Cholesterol 7-alpha-monooxygenase n=1 Tax=Achaetomium macrosporum TaxID=79813 RepID=A0AAN7CIS7_9PEZI|nr:cholesterol 7-alpha-monooxygenase [Achaetomium macrosporum]
MATFSDLAAYIAEKTSALSVTFGVLFTGYLLLCRWQLVKAHPDEPPIIPSAVPFVGHLLRMALQGGRYVKNLGLRNPDKPIFTLPVPRSRMYIVTDPSLAAAVQRASKTLSFTPLVPDITQRVLGLDDDTVTIVRQHIDPEPGEPRGFLADIHDLVYSELGPGETLNELSLDAAGELSKQVDEYARILRQEKGGEETVDLLQWIRHFVAIATANFLYGDENPLALHPELESAFWDFDHGLGALLMGVFPSITARKAYRGREAFAAAFEEYLTLGRHISGDGRKGASSIVQKRVAVALQHGWTLRAAARSELSFLFAGIVNTATTTFWIILQLFASSTPDLLSAIRSELSSSSCLTPRPDPNKEAGTLTLSLEKLKTASPTLQSILRECLRQNSDTYSTRLVKAPTTLSHGGSRYHLKANAIVQISGGTMHSDARIWGPDVDVFNPYRFHNTTSNSTTDTNSTTTSTTTDSSATAGAVQAPIHPAAFRAFGGGKTLCPGRHFAVTEIQAFVALLVTHFDIVAAGPGGPGRAKEAGGKKKIRVPGKEDGVLPVHVLEPKERVEVTVRIRDSVIVGR